MFQRSFINFAYTRNLYLKKKTLIKNLYEFKICMSTEALFISVIIFEIKLCI